MCVLLNFYLIAGLSLPIAHEVGISTNFAISAITIGFVTNTIAAGATGFLIKMLGHKASLIVAHLIGMLASGFLLLSVKYQKYYFVLLFVVFMDAAFSIAYVLQNYLIELQLRKLAKGTVGHGIKGVVDSIVTALSYYLYPTVYQKFGMDWVVIVSFGVLVFGLGLAIIYNSQIDSLLDANETVRLEEQTPHDVGHEILPLDSKLETTTLLNHASSPNPKPQQPIELEKMTPTPKDYLDAIESDDCISQLTYTYFNKMNSLLILIRVLSPSFFQTFIFTSTIILEKKFRLTLEETKYYMSSIILIDGVLSVGSFVFAAKFGQRMYIVLLGVSLGLAGFYMMGTIGRDSH
jgi:MFS family permease